MADVNAGWTDESFIESNKGRMVVFFHEEQVKNNFKTKEAGRPIFTPEVQITKLVAGDSKLVINRRVRDTDKEEYPVEWARFEQKKERLIPGTPLENWPVLSDTQKAEFRALNIFTIDQFAQLPDSAGGNIMGFNELRKKAKAFISATENLDFVEKMKADTDKKLAERDIQLGELREQLRLMQDALTAKVVKPAPAKRGRKPANKAPLMKAESLSTA